MPSTSRRRGGSIAFLLLVHLVHPCLALADIAPTRFDGTTLSPIESTQIEMKSEDVRITCGTICEVRASFHMRNGTGKPCKEYVGFPIHQEVRRQFDYAFQVVANGRKITRFTKATSEVDLRGIPMEISWFGWKHTFPPGDTTVEVQYRIKPSASYYNPYSENIHYILHTGSLWKGPIGRATIEVEMPSGLHPEQIFTKTSSPGYSLDGNRISWKFKDLEPDLEDDIRLEILPARVFSRIRDLRDRLRADPDNPDLKLQLARHYFPIGFHKGITFYLPLQMTPQKYEETLAKLPRAEDRKLLAEVYVRGRPCEYCAGLPKEEAARIEANNNHHHTLPYDFINKDPTRYFNVVAALAAIDFLPQSESVSAYALRGQALLEELLDEDPGNAEAWFTYLSNYYRFKFSGYNPRPMCQSPIQPRQIEAVRRAFHHCPNHEGIALWHDLVVKRLGNADQRLRDYLEARCIHDPPWE